MLRPGDTSPEVERLTQTLVTLGLLDEGMQTDTYEDFVKDAVQYFQTVWMLDPDGVVGPQTEKTLTRAIEKQWAKGLPLDMAWFGSDPGEFLGGVHPRWGALSAVRGAVSWFGGPNDQGDRMYGLALLGSTLESARKRHPVASKLVLRPVSSLAPGMGLSWALDPDSAYVASRWVKRPNPDVGRIVVRNTLNGRWAVAVPVDYGPGAYAQWGDYRGQQRAVDVSFGLKKYLGLGIDQTVQIGWARDGATPTLTAKTETPGPLVTKSDPGGWGLVVLLAAVAVLMMR